MRLTGRDGEILRHVHRHRFLRSSHLTSLLPGSPQQLRRRLQRLYHRGYLDRPRCQIDYYHRGGSRSIAYGLGNKGAAALRCESGRIDWSWKNQVGRLFLEHALMVSDVMVAVELASRKRPDVRLLAPKEEQWTVDVGMGLKCGLIPDRVFGLEVAGRTAWFCVEADRGTMPVKRQGLERSSIHRKLLAYAATWTQNIHRTRFGWQRFRVLIVTTDKQRLETMLETCRSLPHGRGLFLFTDSKSLSNHTDFFAARWRTCRDGELVGLLD